MPQAQERWGNPRMKRVKKRDLERLLNAARTAQVGPEAMRTQDAVFKALLNAKVYAHVPREGTPPGRIRFIQFVRPDNGQTVLPFFSDRAQAEAPQRTDTSIVSMEGRELFELTRGATLMLNPNIDKVALYPPEISALLEGRKLGCFSKHEIEAGVSVGACPPTKPADDLTIALRELFEREQTVRAAYLVEIHQLDESAQVSLLLVIVAAPKFHERLLQLATLEVTANSAELNLPLDLTFLEPEEPFPELYRKGIQFFGT